MKTLFPKSALSRRVASFSSLPYSLIISVENKEIRENYQCDHFLLRELSRNKGLIINFHVRCNSNCRMRDLPSASPSGFSFRFAPLPMTKWGERFLASRSLPAVEMTGVLREKGGGGEAAASPPPHHPPYHQCHGVISNEVRNLQNYKNDHLKCTLYMIFIP